MSLCIPLSLAPLDITVLPYNAPLIEYLRQQKSAGRRIILATGADLSIAKKIAEIKKQDGPNLHVWGSGNLVQTLLKHDLVDALWLKIFPVTLGAGKKLFADGTIPVAFKVTESTVTPKGVIIINYERAGAVPTGSM